MSEFIGQDIWEILVPMGWSGKPRSIDEPYKDADKPYRLTIYPQHICLKCGVRLYEDLMKMKS